ncbi:MAG: hypothetical protein GY870_10540, partial [archaeon]|nr:hypothetical protein [archaeon]
KQYKKSSKNISDLYVADILDNEDIPQDWTDDDFYEEIKERDIIISDLAFEDEDEEDEEDEEDLPKKKGRKKKSKTSKSEEEDEEDIVIEKITEEEEKISEELFGGSDDSEEEELEFEDETKEVTDEYDAKEAKLKMARSGDVGDEIDAGMDFNNLPAADSGSSGDSIGGFEAPVIEKTPDGKERCPYCQKEFGSVSRHISRCKRAPPGAAEAIKAKSKKTTKKKTSRKKSTKKKTSRKKSTKKKSSSK